MKVWNGYGSEHSANLVMIGHFKSVESARSAVEKLNALRDGAAEDDADEFTPSVFETKRFSDQIFRLLSRLNIYSLQANELKQFLYDIDWKVNGDRVVVETEEIDISGLLKVLVDGGARVEVFSAHFHKDSGYGRGE